MLSDIPSGQLPEQNPNHKSHPNKPKCNCGSKFSEYDCICCEWSGLVYFDCNAPNCPCENDVCSCRRLLCLTCNRQAHRATSHLTFSKKSFDYHQKNDDCLTLRDALGKRFPDDDFVLNNGCGIIMGRCDKETNEVIETLGPFYVANGLVFYEGNTKTSGSASFFFGNCSQDDEGVWYTGDPREPITLSPIAFQNNRIKVDSLAKDFLTVFKYVKPTRQEEEALLAKRYHYLSKNTIGIMIERDFSKGWCGYSVTPNPHYLSNAIELKYFLDQLRMDEHQ